MFYFKLNADTTRVAIYAGGTTMNPLTPVINTTSLVSAFSVPVIASVQFSSVTQSCPTLRPHESQHARPPCPSPTPRVHSDSRPSSQ